MNIAVANKPRAPVPGESLPPPICLGQLDRGVLPLAALVLRDHSRARWTKRGYEADCHVGSLVDFGCWTRKDAELALVGLAEPVSSSLSDALEWLNADRYRLDSMTFDSKRSETPPASRWLAEWGRLKGDGPAAVKFRLG